MVRLNDVLRVISPGGRQFSFIKKFERVRIRIPTLTNQKYIPAGIIKLDGKATPDRGHFYDGVMLSSGVVVNRHYYFPEAHKRARVEITATVVVVLEKMNDRSFVRLNIYEFDDNPRAAKLEIKFSSNGEEGDNVVDVVDGHEKIVFQPIGA